MQTSQTNFDHLEMILSTSHLDTKNKTDIYNKLGILIKEQKPFEAERLMQYAAKTSLISKLNLSILTGQHHNLSKSDQNRLNLEQKSIFLHQQAMLTKDIQLLRVSERIANGVTLARIQYDLAYFNDKNWQSKINSAIIIFDQYDLQDEIIKCFLLKVEKYIILGQKDLARQCLNDMMQKNTDKYTIMVEQMQQWL